MVLLNFPALGKNGKWGRVSGNRGVPALPSQWKEIHSGVFRGYKGNSNARGESGLEAGIRIIALGFFALSLSLFALYEGKRREREREREFFEGKVIILV